MKNRLALFALALALIAGAATIMTLASRPALASCGTAGC
jgi:hypothetical protein